MNFMPPIVIDWSAEPVKAKLARDPARMALEQRVLAKRKSASSPPKSSTLKGGS